MYAKSSCRPFTLFTADTRKRVGNMNSSYAWLALRGIWEYTTVTGGIYPVSPASKYRPDAGGGCGRLGAAAWKLITCYEWVLLGRLGSHTPTPHGLERERNKTRSTVAYPFTRCAPFTCGLTHPIAVAGETTPYTTLLRHFAHFPYAECRHRATWALGISFRIIISETRERV